MPLVSGSSREDISKNIAIERNAGKPAAQAAAIAYAKDSNESSRKFDINDWFEVEANPLSKVGIYQYSGKFISKDLDPNQMFAVYRPEEELADQECIESFKLVPWVNDHPRKLLGDPDKGAIAAEEKGIEGVIGEKVFFDKLDMMLKGNIKVFSKSLADAINAGKEELSVGYQCKYEYAPGEFGGESYQYVQRQIRGNHLATVNDGRMGPDVAVLDEFQFTIDGKEFKIMKKVPKIRAVINKLLTYANDAEEKAEKGGSAEEKSEIAQLQELLKKVAPLIKQLAETHSVMTGPETEEEPDATGSDPLDVAAKDADEEKKKEDEAKAVKDAEEAKAAKDAEEAEKEKKGTGMDAAEIKKLIDEAIKLTLKPAAVMDAKELLVQVAQRDKLANNLSHFIGTFDSSEMTLAEVEVYGCSKLGLKPAKGQEGAFISGYLANRAIPRPVAIGHAMDSKDGKNWLTEYTDGKKAA